MRTRITIMLVHDVSLEYFFVRHHFATMFTWYLCAFFVYPGHMVGVMCFGAKAFVANLTDELLDKCVNVGNMPFQVVAIDKWFTALVAHEAESALMHPFDMLLKLPISAESLAANSTWESFVGHPVSTKKTTILVTNTYYTGKQSKVISYL